MTEGNASQFVIYQSGDGQIKLDVRFVDETVWLTQQQLAELFQTSRTNVVEHIQHIYEEGELDAAATCREFRQVRTEGTREVAATTEKCSVVQMREQKQNQWRTPRG